MLSMEDVEEMDELDIENFVMEDPETIAEVTEVIDFARELEEAALDELEFREKHRRRS